MSITDELRAYAGNFYLFRYKDVREKLDAIADCIDKAHQKDMNVLRAQCGDMWQKGYAVCHAELMEGHPVIAADLEKAGWVKLPVDADDEPIHVGDVLTDDAEFKSEGKVMRLMLEDKGWVVSLGCTEWTVPSIHEWHHHREPTVDDLLFSYGQACIRASNEAVTDAAKQTMLAKLRKDYAAKLRLAGDAQ